MAEVTAVSEAEVNTTDPGISKPEAAESEAVETPKLTKISYSNEDPRTEEERSAGIPWFNNEGMLGVQLDRDWVIGLLKDEGLSAKEISDLKATFTARRLVDVDLYGSPIGGIHKGNEIVVYTSVPVVTHKDLTPPELVENRFQLFQSANLPEEIADTLAHELKHFVQFKQGVDMPNSWAAESMEVHANLPTEKEAIEFANKHKIELASRVKLTDEQGIFKKATEIIPQTADNKYATGLVNEEMVARFYDDSLEADESFGFINEFNKLIRGGSSTATLPEFVTTGQELVKRKVLSEYEFGYMLDRLRNT